MKLNKRKVISEISIIIYHFDNYLNYKIILTLKNNYKFIILFNNNNN